MQLQVLVKNKQSATLYVQVDDARWSLDTWDLDNGQPIPVYSCISYAWGRGKVPNPFHASTDASDRSIPALRTVSRQLPACEALWIDAFCVPGQDEPLLRATTLESMGYIYSRAQDVIVVLSNAAAPALRHIRSEPDELLRTEHLAALEREEWSSRAWTYQEAANSKTIVFTAATAETGTDTCPIIDFLELLSPLGHVLSKLGPEARTQYPRLDDLEDMLADSAVASYHTRSALQVMTMMEKRTQERADDHFYAMIGAITTDPASAAVPGSSACEAFMTLCERKGDFSFIYSLTPRDAQMRWRPVSNGNDDLPVVFARHNWGESQPGHFEAGTLYLDNMLRLAVEPLSEEAAEFIRRWTKFTAGKGDAGEEPVGIAAAQRLFNHGYKGSLNAISTQHGNFYPCREGLDAGNISFIAVSGSIRWNIGAPALAQYQSRDVFEYIPGVFVGDVGSLIAQVTSVCLD